MDIISPVEYDIDNTCRLCLRSGIKLQPIFQQVSDQPSVCKLVNSFTNIEIQPDDGLPSTVCQYCAQTTRRMHEFKVNCELSDKKMRDYLKQQKHCVYLTVKDEFSSDKDPITSGSSPYASGDGSDYDMMDSETEEKVERNDKVQEMVADTADEDPLDALMRASCSKPHETTVSTPVSNDTKLILNYLMNMRDTQDQMQKHIVQMTTDMAELKDTVHCQSRRSPTRITLKVYKCKQYLPISTYEDLLTFDKLLIGEFKVDFVAYLSSIGGKSLSSMVSNLCNAVFAVDMLPTTTWCGTSKKQRLASTVAPRVIIDVCQTTFSNYTQSEIKTVLRKFVMHSTDRYKKHHNIQPVGHIRDRE